MMRIYPDFDGWRGRGKGTKEERADKARNPAPFAGGTGAVFYVCLAISVTCLGAAGPIAVGAPIQRIHDRSSPASTPASSEVWYGVHLGADRIGYAGVSTRPTGSGGRRLIRSESQMFTRLKLLGVEVSEEMNEVDLFRPDGVPVRTDFDNKSNGHHSHLIATFSASNVHCVVDDGQQKTVRDVPIPRGTTLSLSNSYTLPADRMKPGKVWTDVYFDPATLAIETMTSRVTGRARIEFEGRTISAWQVESHSVMGNTNMAAASNGDVLTMSMPLGISLVKEPRSIARAALEYHPSTDLAMAGSAEASGAPITHPRQVDTLELQLTGVPANRVIPSGPGQNAKEIAPGTWRLRIWSTPSPSAKPMLPETRPADALQATPELNADNTAMKAQTRTILAGETDSGKAVTLLHDWVNSHMRARYDIAVLRSGMDVLQDEEGVCRDYAVLYTSLARAAGIPTRICAGLVYWQGRFYYHAWAESYIGAWVRVDATLPGQFVDATHVTLARGDARDMYRVVGLVGTFKLNVISAHDRALGSTES